jgi:hypothetical protein
MIAISRILLPGFLEHMASMMDLIARVRSSRESVVGVEDAIELNAVCDQPFWIELLGLSVPET